MYKIDSKAFAQASSKLSIVFLTKNTDMNRGSYRIWVNYLAKTLQGVGANVSIDSGFKSDSSYPEANVVIFDKGISEETIAKVKQNCSAGTITGVINPSGDSHYPVDFAIVGSREEESSLSQYGNIVFVPLVEPPLHELPVKYHADNQTIKIGYHGNNLHLSSFASCGLKGALELYQKELKLVNRNVELTIISNKEMPRWLIGKPAIDIKYVKYNWETFPQLITGFDIGIVPNCYYRKPISTLSYFLRKTLNMELSGADIIMRMKNKSNFGRLLVFMQAGIPAIADLTPSHLDLLSDSKNGFCAANEMAWLRGLRMLTSAAKRNEMANNAKAHVSLNYEPAYWAQRFMLDVLEIHDSLKGNDKENVLNNKPKQYTPALCLL
ncbi:MAG: hypothetical protein JWQ66_3400 [Mucilaginibacter sp.]|nr:hypothetical protein [Mucilaginibacter sp.]